jgi:acyl-CoA synthetase (AMP-forming)/AMP-acid ligase II
MGPGERLIAVLPFFHIYGLTVLMNVGLSSGATVVTMPRFDLEQFLTVLQDQKITRAYVAPPIVLALAKHPLVDKFDLSTLTGILSGAAPLDADLADACANRLGCDVKQGYGMTELSPVSHAMPDGVAMPAGSVGVALPNTESRLVAVETGEDAAAGEPGELWVRGPQVMRGYLNNDEATAATIDSDGWLHTGDVAVVDEQGAFYIVDRVKELIKYKGYQVAPAELEALLLGHPKIADAAVIGVQDEEGGEIPKAFVVVVSGQEITAEEVMAHVEAHVAPHKKVRAVEFIDAIPKSASGKILRKDLRARGAATAL